jgi:chromosome segregation ATPase
MARAGITYTEVAMAAKRLSDENKTISADNVRDLIGAGSKTTIIKHLNTWRDGHLIESQASGIPVSLMEAIKSLWSLVKDEANKEISAHEAEATAKVEAVRKLLQQHQEQRDADVREIDTIRATLASQRNNISELTSDLHAEITEKTRIQERANGLERQCAQQMKEIARLQDTTQKTQINLEHYQEANIRLKDTHSLERENERNAYLTLMRTLETELNKVTQEKAVIETALKHTYESLAQANQLLTDLQEDVKTLRQIAADNKIQNALLQQRNEELRTQISTLMHQNEILSDRFSDEHEKTNILCNENSRLVMSMQKLEDQIHGITDEKLFLIQEKSELLGQLKAFQQQLTTNMSKEVKEALE